MNSTSSSSKNPTTSNADSAISALTRSQPPGLIRPAESIPRPPCVASRRQTNNALVLRNNYAMSAEPPRSRSTRVVTWMLRTKPALVSKRTTLKFARMVKAVVENDPNRLRQLLSVGGKPASFIKREYNPFTNPRFLNPDTVETCVELAIAFLHHPAATPYAGMHLLNLALACHAGEAVISQLAYLSNQPDGEGRMPLLLATAEDDLELVKTLIMHGAHIDLSNSHGRTPLMVAAAHGHQRLVAFFLEKGTNLFHMDKRGDTALTLAALHRNNAVVDQLLAYPVDPDHGPHYRSLRKRDFRKILMQEVQQQSVERVAGLLADYTQFITLDAVTDALFLAIDGGENIGLVKLLVKHGAKIERPSRVGSTAAMVASMNGHRETYEFLMATEMKAFPRHFGFPLIVSQQLVFAANVGSWKIATILLRSDAIVDYSLLPGEILFVSEFADDKLGIGETPLMVATRRGHIKMTGLLLEHGADMTRQDGAGASILQREADRAFMTGEFAMYDLLVRWFTVTDVDQTVLSFELQRAAAIGSIASMDWLLNEANVGIDDRDEASGESALMQAVNYNRLDAVRWLLNHPALRHAHLQTPDRGGLTVLDMARQTEQPEIFDLVLGAGMRLARLAYAPWTPEQYRFALHDAIWIDSTESVRRLLQVMVAARYSLHERDELMTIAVGMRNPEIHQMLIDAGFGRVPVDVRMPDRGGT